MQMAATLNRLEETVNRLARNMRRFQLRNMVRRPNRNRNRIVSDDEEEEGEGNQQPTNDTVRPRRRLIIRNSTSDEEAGHKNDFFLSIVHRL